MKQNIHRLAPAKPAGLYLIELRSRLARLHRPVRKHLFGRVATIPLAVLPQGPFSMASDAGHILATAAGPEPSPAGNGNQG